MKFFELVSVGEDISHQVHLVIKKDFITISERVGVSQIDRRHSKQAFSDGFGPIGAFSADDLEVGFQFFFHELFPRMGFSFRFLFIFMGYFACLFMLFIIKLLEHL